MIDKKQENWRSCNTNPNTILKHSICLIKVIYILVLVDRRWGWLIQFRNFTIQGHVYCRYENGNQKPQEEKTDRRYNGRNKHDKGTNNDLKSA
jgi:hypothetical protein